MNYTRKENWVNYVKFALVSMIAVFVLGVLTDRAIPIEEQYRTKNDCAQFHHAMNKWADQNGYARPCK